MKSRMIIVAALLSAMAAPALAESESIGPLTVVPLQTINLYYPNKLPPHPTHKILQFSGLAWTNVPGALGFLDIHFDYLDATGQEVILDIPGSPFPVFGGVQVPIFTPPIILPFCPTEVSIHFDAIELPITVQGTFRHECVPEPATAGLLTLGTMGLIRLRRNRQQA
ncbi:MAG TPA: PEP-CTERM sorting domain-containing protein [Phycisphaerae bacterium]|nr:PEP-CTERM sorting domain-containing protein [Phycisphaerae bacterium]